MLLILMYHRIAKGPFANSKTMMKQHLEYIAKNFPVVTPGDTLPSKLSICLTFDDANRDFYEYTYPLLKKLNLKATLGVPVQPILENNPKHCTWDQIIEMSQNNITIASHSYSHQDLTKENINLEQEIQTSKEILSEKIKKEVNTFIYPFGKMNQQVHEQVKKHYTYIMRIGSATNKNWQNKNHLLYRISADNLTSPNQPLKPLTLLKSRLNYYLNSLRNK